MTREEKFSDLASWMDNRLAEKLAKKLSEDEVRSLLIEFARVAREARNKE